MRKILVTCLICGGLWNLYKFVLYFLFVDFVLALVELVYRGCGWDLYQGPIPVSGTQLCFYFVIIIFLAKYYILTHLLCTSCRFCFSQRVSTREVA